MNAWDKVRAAPGTHYVDHGALDLPYRSLPCAAVALRRAADAAQRDCRRGGRRTIVGYSVGALG